MKTKIVVHTPDRQPKTKVVKDKEREANKDGQNIVRFLDQAFHLDGETFEVTHIKRLFGKTEFITYHYANGNPNPLPLYSPKEIEIEDGMDSETVNALFTPWFYRQVTPKDAGFGETAGRIILYATAGLSAYTLMKVLAISKFLGVS